jgi:endonuclease/exonuclease/phosphatase family metal-dependent hydrolase
MLMSSKERKYRAKLKGMNILFLNTWHSKMPPELGAYIQGVAATVDVFCFTEAFEEDLYVYETLLTDFEKVSAQKQQGTLHFGNVMYVRKTLRIIGVETFFEEEPGVGFAHAVTFEKDNRETVVCSVHGIPYPGDKLDTPERLYQTETLLGAFAGRSRVVIGGDFNLLPETQSIRKFAANGYRDLIADYDVETTRNYLSFGKHPESPQYFADYAFTSLDVNVKDFIVPAVIVSDHQPLELSID